ncbi:C40 family peptidase [Pseudaminobacter sp. 19-2017]|uniref:C40 family peptidase n=1 Tax=Pseudaminobacter soli (ex Zhang et al. 2022) TaxID=2831468 RepID=A0A942E2C1_9HYPH|nr:NlpC/P60 family protein [Pseudaminobacter soli]MBS3649736.1 C40 family peptidase [Pseudaminobacter soli]
MTLRDPRLHAYRPDLADLRLKGLVEAERFVEGRPATVSAPVADMRAASRPDSGINTQLLRGDTVTVFDTSEGYAWVQADFDGYVGYLAEGDLSPTGSQPTHRVIVPRTFLYPGPDLRFPRIEALTIGSELGVLATAETRGTRYAQLDSGGWVVESHLGAKDSFASDYVAIAETLLNTPYLWGGTSAFGIDCSGLVQLSQRLAGRSAPRDSDMQANGLGSPLEPGPDYRNLSRGDLVFWKGHVAIMTDPETIIHATGSTMMVTREPLKEAIERIRRFYGDPTGFRRPELA